MTPQKTGNKKPMKNVRVVPPPLGYYKKNSKTAHIKQVVKSIIKSGG